MKRLLALVVPLVLAGGPALGAPTPPAHHASAHVSRDRQPAGRLPVSVVVGGIAPGYLTKPTQTLRLHGLLQNDSDSSYQQLSVRLRFSSRSLTSRGELEAYADDKGPDPAQGGPSVPLPSAVPSGGHEQWLLSMPVRQLGFRTFGVYPIDVEVDGPSGMVGHKRTFVTYYPKGANVEKTRISWIWPVVDQPHRANDTTFVDSRLEREFSGGRLQHIVAAAARTRTPIGWLVDPALVDDAMAMSAAGGYTVKGVHRDPNVAAASWLTTLRGATSQKLLIATPYADADALSLSRAGMARDIGGATAAAMPAMTAAHLAGPTTSVAVPPDGLADQRTLSNLVAAGARTILLDSAILPDLQAQITSDPLTRQTIHGTKVDLIAYDDTLNKVVGASTGNPGSAVLAEQRFLAETAMITSEAPFRGRAVVVVPPRRWDPDPAFARNLLTRSASAPWLQAVELRDVQSMRPVNRTLQAQKIGAGLSLHYLRQVKGVADRVRQFSTIFQPPQSAFTLSVPRMESSAWNDQTRAGAALRGTLNDELAAATGEIRVLNEQVTLAGKSARIPITISNDLGSGTVRVKLHAYSQNATRLRVESDDSTLTLQAGHKDQVTLYMKAAANGPAYVNLELLAPNGRPFGDTRVLQVTATGYGRTAVLITGISLAVLFLGVGVRVIRRRGDRVKETSA